MKKAKTWYAAMRDLDDSDWGTGSYSKREAAKMVRKLRREGYSEAFIEIVSENEVDSISIGRIHDVRYL